MTQLELEPREIYLTYLAVKSQLNVLMQYPDPLHEEKKTEYSNLLGLYQEALELATTSKKTSTKKG